MIENDRDSHEGGRPIENMDFHDTTPEWEHLSLRVQVIPDSSPLASGLSMRKARPASQGWRDRLLPNSASCPGQTTVPATCNQPVVDLALAATA